MKKIVAFDLDGTILKRGRTRISKEFCELLKTLNKSGITVVISSGRNMPQLEEILLEVTDIIWISALDGAVVKQGKKIVFSREIKENTAKTILNTLKNARNTKIIINKKSKTETIEEITDFSEINRISVFGDGAIFAGKKATFAYEKSEVSTYIAGGWYEINPYGADKGAALAEIAEISGAGSEIYAFGDNYNDIAMFKIAKKSWAVKNSPPEVIFAADGVTDDVIKTVRSEIL